jgi:predicted amidohydrolase YtcJ
MVIWGGPIYTAVDARPKVEAVAVAAGKIAFVGDRAGAKALVGPKTKVIDLRARASSPASPTATPTCARSASGS